MASDSARYRRVEVLIWSDERFSDIGAVQKLVFLFLLTHPQQTGVGAFRASMAGLADELSLDYEDFIQALDSLVELGMVEYNSKRKFVALPNWLKYNQPKNPNVVKSWNSQWDLIPECDLKENLLDRVTSYLESLDESSVEGTSTWRESFTACANRGFSNGEKVSFPKEIEESEKPFAKEIQEPEKAFGKEIEKAEIPFRKENQKVEKPFGKEIQQTEKPFAKENGKSEFPYRNHKHKHKLEHNHKQQLKHKPEPPPDGEEATRCSAAAIFNFVQTLKHFKRQSREICDALPNWEQEFRIRIDHALLRSAHDRAEDKARESEHIRAPLPWLRTFIKFEAANRRDSLAQERERRAALQKESQKWNLPSGASVRAVAGLEDPTKFLGQSLIEEVDAKKASLRNMPKANTQKTWQALDPPMKQSKEMGTDSHTSEENRSFAEGKKPDAKGFLGSEIEAGESLSSSQQVEDVSARTQHALTRSRDPVASQSEQMSAIQSMQKRLVVGGRADSKQSANPEIENRMVVKA